MASKTVSKKDMACNRPKATPDHPKKSHIVKACEAARKRLFVSGNKARRLEK
jgi:hypothetical protein